MKLLRHAFVLVAKIYYFTLSQEVNWFLCRLILNMRSHQIGRTNGREHSSIVHVDNPRKQASCWSTVLTSIRKYLVFSHHQKTIMCDAAHPSDSSKRRLVAFVGGFDITCGRYDTQEHPLFSTLSTVHKDDFFQSDVKEASVKSGPRIPWHEVHSKVSCPDTSFTPRRH